jgi:hypothetical protein
MTLRSGKKSATTPPSRNVAIAQRDAALSLSLGDGGSRRHVARFMLMALYTGTRASAVCAAALKPARAG